MDLIAQIDMWGDQVASRPAHVSGTEVLTYGQLKQRSDQFASHLSHLLPPDHSPVAILGHKQPEMLVGFIGSLKAGHPYVPLDTSIPELRVRAVVDAARARLFTAEEVQEISRRVTPMKSFDRQRLAAGDAWYIIFTSGSTGEPKGVMITRGCLESFLAWTLDEQAFLKTSEVFLKSSPFLL